MERGDGGNGFRHVDCVGEVFGHRIWDLGLHGEQGYIASGLSKEDDILRYTTALHRTKMQQCASSRLGRVH